MMRTRSARAGFSLVETVIATGIGAGMLFGATSIWKSSGKSSTEVFRRTGLASAATHVVDRIAREMQMSGFAGEDANGNDVLDAGEDTNRNGRLDADWSLTDGSSSQTFTFNIVQRDWLWSGPITYTVASGVVRRTEGASSVVMCRTVQNFSVTRVGTEVIIVLTLVGTDGKGATWAETARRVINVRN